MIASLALAFAAVLAQQATCDSLKTLQNTKITTVEFVPAARGGENTLLARDAPRNALAC